MSKKKTISQRWYRWNEVDPAWSYSALISFIGSVCFLGLHLGIVDAFWFFICKLTGWNFVPIYTGLFRTIGLFGLIGLACYTEAVMFFRAKKFPELAELVWWWFTFHTYVVLGVIGWEIASYFFGSQL